MQCAKCCGIFQPLLKNVAESGGTNITDIPWSTLSINFIPGAVSSSEYLPASSVQQSLLTSRLGCLIHRNWVGQGPPLATDEENFVPYQNPHIRGGPLWCPHGPYTSTKRADVKRHIESHAPGEKYKCFLCSNSFATSFKFNRHMSSYKEEKPYKCENCPFASVSPSSLDQHKRTHTAEKPYKCEKCLYAANRRGHLDEHKRTHIGEKPYKCEVCFYSSTRKGNLDRYMRTHPRADGFQCTLCSFVCSSTESLIQHICAIWNWISHKYVNVIMTLNRGICLLTKILFIFCGHAINVRLHAPLTTDIFVQPTYHKAFQARALQVWIVDVLLMHFILAVDTAHQVLRFFPTTGRQGAFWQELYQ